MSLESSELLLLESQQKLLFGAGITLISISDFKVTQCELVGIKSFFEALFYVFSYKNSYFTQLDTL
jgi:hypothetical protein